MRWSFSHESRSCEGETANGDAIVVRRDGDRVLFAVVDAIGHGPVAAEVANEARRHLEEVSIDVSVGDVVAGLHEHLRGTRGAAATVCVVRGNEIEGAGVGNVEVSATLSALSCVLTPGILGVRMSRLRVFSASVATDTRIIVHSDGISRRFDLSPLRALPAAAACRAIMEDHRKPHDDATVLVADAETR